jgi:hypothetical protein
MGLVELLIAALLLTLIIDRLVRRQKHQCLLYSFISKCPSYTITTTSAHGELQSLAPVVWNWTMTGDMIIAALMCLIVVAVS